MISKRTLVWGVKLCYKRGVYLLAFIVITMRCFYLTPVANEENDPYLVVKERAKGPLESNDTMLIKYVRKHILHPPSTLNYNLNQNKNYKVYAKDLTWNFTHSKLMKLFSDEPPGFFVEAGALDGEMLSNTLWLEKKKGWRGLLVEPDDVNYAMILNKNRKAWSAHSCLATTPYPKISIFSSFSPVFKKFDFNKDYDWLRRSLTFDYDAGLKIGETDPSQRVFTSIQCFPLETFLLSLNVSVVDFLSLDIQGGEWEVLKWFPWKKIRLRSMSVEFVVSSDKRGVVSQDFIKFVKNKGYTLIGISKEPDYFFIANDEKILKQKLNVLQ